VSRRRAALVAIALLTAGCTSSPTPTRSPPSPSPKGPVGTIAFSSNRLLPNGPPWNIYVIRTDGSGLTQLTHVQRDGAFDPAWSPDGTKIAYAIYHGATGWHLWVVDADGSHKMLLTQGLQPAWSSDGTQIVYTIQPTGGVTDRIYVMKADGTGKRAVTSGPCDDYPTWTPNGMIVFARAPAQCDGSSGTTTDVFAVNPDGGGLIRLTTGQPFGNPSLSPDGTRIAIQDKERHRIVIVRIYGAGTVTLFPTDFGTPWSQTGWSPDGGAIAFAGSYTDTTDLYVVNADGSGLTKVPNGEDASDPAWRPT
jgi:Tol biopolymer transport system component